MTDVLSRLQDALADRYSVEKKLGEGGMALVYLAQDLKHNRQVAIKVFKPEVADSMGEERFLLEIETAASLSHPHILTVHDSGAADGLLYYVMPFVDGESLRDRIDREKQLSIEDSFQIAQEVANALTHAHNQGVVHRDIKPENIMMYGGHAVIADFGIARALSAAGGERLTSTGMAVGTPTYMSPEQASGDDVDARSDIYALGCLVYEMLAGQPPFTGSTVSAIVSQHIAAPPPSPSLVRHTVSESASLAIVKALAKTPADRFVSASDFAKALKGEGGVTSGATTAVFGAGNKQLPFSWMKIAQTLGVYALLVVGAFLLLDYLVNRFVLSPYLPRLGVISLLTLLPTAGIVAFKRSRGPDAVWTRWGKIGIPANIVAAGAVVALLFGTKDLGAATSSILVTDEDGNAVERVVPKTEFRKRLIMYYFDADGLDSSDEWLRYGLPGGMELDLAQDLYFQTKSPEQIADGFKTRGYPDGFDIPLALQRELAENEHIPNFLNGSITAEDGTLSVTTKLYETSSGRLISERSFTGSDPFVLIDSMTLQLKHDLDIPEHYIEEMEDLPVSELATHSTLSFELLMRGLITLTLHEDWTESASLLERAVAEDQTNALAQLILYQVSVLGNDIDQASTAIQAAMQHIYRLPEQIQFQVKVTYYDFTQQPEKVLAVSRMRIELSPDDIQGRAQLAALLLMRGERDEAIEQFETILEIDPTQHSYRSQLGDLHREKGGFEQAVEYYQSYAAEYPEDRDAYSSLGGVYRVMGEHDLARESFDRALLLEPNNVITMVSLARLERIVGNLELELEQLTRTLDLALTAQDRAVVLGALRAHHMFRGEYTTAIEYQERELEELQPVTAPVPFLMRTLSVLNPYVEIGRRQEAEQTYTRVEANLGGGTFGNLAAIGRVIIALAAEEPDTAEAALLRLEDFIQRFGAEVLRVQVVQAEARIHELRNEYEEAIQDFEAAFDLDRSDVTNRWYIGRCYRKLGDLNAAEEAVGHALRVVPTNPHFLLEMALVAADKGDEDTAIGYLESALEVWANADAEFKPAREAREKLDELRGEQ